ncbi:hypothetical protein LCGC14_2516000, partial [marine sediment metagenome]
MVRHNYGVSSMKISKQVPKENTTPVVFRVWNACPCDIIALFPVLCILVPFCLIKHFSLYSSFVLPVIELMGSLRHSLIS